MWVVAIYKLDESLKELTQQKHLKEWQKNVKPFVEEYFAWVKDVLDSQILKVTEASVIIYIISQTAKLDDLSTYNFLPIC